MLLQRISPPRPGRLPDNLPRGLHHSLQKGILGEAVTGMAAIVLAGWIRKTIITLSLSLTGEGSLLLEIAAFPPSESLELHHTVQPAMEAYQSRYFPDSE